jgi:hypothetical protein
VLAFLLVTLAVISALLFLRIPETEIELDVKLSEITFTLATEQTISELTPLAALGVAGLREVHLPSPSSLSSKVFSSTDYNGYLGIRLIPDTAVSPDAKGTITLSPLALDADYRIGVSATGIPREYRVALVGGPVILHAGINGRVRIDFLQDSDRALYSSPRQIVMRSISDGADLDVMLRDTPLPFFSRRILVKDIRFSQVEQYIDLRRTLVRSVSTIKEGALYRNSLNGEKLVLRSGEMLSLSIAAGEIVALEPGTDSLRLHLFARVRDLTAGFGEGERSLMPTYLEWLQAQHRLSLFWAASLYVFGTGLAILRWWGVVQ